MSPLADVDFSNHGRFVIARLHGEVDQSNTHRLGEALTETLVNESLALVIDLTDVDYFDSSGIELIYELRARLEGRGQQLRLVIPARSASFGALRLAGVARHLSLFESLGTALDGQASGSDPGL